jgi:hypothetical protein
VPPAAIRELHESKFRIPDGTPQGKRPPPDSAVTMYWEEQDLKKDATRKVGFAYGLGRVSSSEGSGKLAVTIGGQLVKGEEFTVTALVRDGAENETVTLSLPEGLKRTDGEATQRVPRSERGVSPVTWKVRAEKAGDFEIQVSTSGKISQNQKVTIAGKGLFD